MSERLEVTGDHWGSRGPLSGVGSQYGSVDGESKETGWEFGVLRTVGESLPGSGVVTPEEIERSDWGPKEAGGDRGTWGKRRGTQVFWVGCSPGGIQKG